MNVEKGGESSTESYREKHSQIGAHQISPFEESIKQTDGKTTEYIDQKRSQREGRNQEILNVA